MQRPRGENSEMFTLAAGWLSRVRIRLSGEQHSGGGKKAEMEHVIHVCQVRLPEHQRATEGF